MADDYAVQLGFLEAPQEEDDLVNALFPSKTGGKPVWMNPEHTPKPETMFCGNCEKPMVLLLQMYMPIEDVSSAYHRTIYVFCCPNGDCHQFFKKSFKVLRCQLPRKNAYYDEEAGDEDYIEDEMLLDTFVRSPVCAVCGLRGDKACGRCKKVSYCSKEHQAYHWSSSSNGHKIECGSVEEQMKNLNLADDKSMAELEAGGNPAGSTINPIDHKRELTFGFRSPLLFKEMEIVTDTEPDETTAASYSKEKGLLSKFISSGEQYDVDEKDFTSKEVASDKVFDRFQKRIEREPQQVIRFDGETPLWVSSNNQPTEEDIPTCQCGAKRTFEIQILPQMVYFMELDKSKTPIDWGTLAVFTCPKSCPTTDSYTEEFIWRQPPVM